MVNGWVTVPAGCPNKKVAAMVDAAFRKEMRAKRKPSDTTWRVNAKLDKVPRGWRKAGTKDRPVFRCAVTQVVENFGVKEKVRADLEFTAMPMTGGRYLLTGCRARLSANSEPLDTGHAIIVSVLNEVSDEFEVACYE